MTIFIYKYEEVNGKFTYVEYGRWNDGKITYNSGRVVEMSREEVIHRNNNGYHMTSELVDYTECK